MSCYAATDSPTSLNANLNMFLSLVVLVSLVVLASGVTAYRYLCDYLMRETHVKMGPAVTIIIPSCSGLFAGD